MDNHWDVGDAIDDDSPFGKETEAWWHFYRIGALEDRSWNDEEFNLDAYISLNQDVYVSFQKADGTVDKKRAMYHYIYAGNSEGRVDKFSVPYGLIQANILVITLMWLMDLGEHQNLERLIISLDLVPLKAGQHQHLI